MTFQSERVDLAAPMIAGYSTTSVAWPGFDFDPPTFTGDPASPAAWVDWSFRHMSSNYLTFGGDRFIEGEIEVQIFVEAGVGDLKARQIVDDLETAYTNSDTATTKFRVPEAVPEDGGTDDDGWLLWTWRLPVWRLT